MLMTCAELLEMVHLPQKTELDKLKESDVAPDLPLNTKLTLRVLLPMVWAEALKVVQLLIVTVLGTLAELMIEELVQLTAPPSIVRS